MNLYQFLRFFHSGVSIIIFDIEGIQITKVNSKENIDVDLLDYQILDITIGLIDDRYSKYGLYITIQK